MSLAEEGPTFSLKMVIKKDGRVMSSMVHTLSDDRNTEPIRGTSTKPRRGYHRVFRHRQTSRWWLRLVRNLREH